MKIHILILFVGLMIISSCKKDSSLPVSTVEFKVGHLAVTNGNNYSTTYYNNQDTLYVNEIDTILIIRVIEDNLTSLVIDTIEAPNPKDFTIYLNTLYDDERFCTCERAYMSGGGRSKNSLTTDFRIPVRKAISIMENKKVELGNQDFLRISYESVYSGLNKVKTIVIL
jgi:hypothetical protein